MIILWLFNFQICILITDGRSQDNVQEPAQKLRSQGVYIFAVGMTFLSKFLQLEFCCCCYLSCFHKLKISICLSGVKSADKNELATISSQPTRDFIFFVGDFKLLNTLLPLVSPQVCSKAGGTYASDGL